MNKETSIYLDFIRFSAAMVVMVGHLSGVRFSGGLFWQVGPFMDDAVMVFFVLSGFVIAHVVSRAPVNAREYFVARAARIYSVAIPALVLTFCLDYLGKSIKPDLYSPVWGYDGRNLLAQFTAALFFVNQLWQLHMPVGSMLPYWSLGYEVWYYLFFGVVYFAKPQWRKPLLLAALLVAGPRIVALFPVWLMGYGTYQYTRSQKIPSEMGVACLVFSLAAYGAYAWLGRQWLADAGAAFNRFGIENLLTRYCVACLFSAHLVGISWLSRFGKGLLNNVANPIRWLSGATFTIYLFHMPIAQFLTTIIPFKPTDVQTRVAMFGGTLVLLFFIAQFTERKKQIWSRWIDQVCR